jgi:hypothetical protein
MGFFIKLILLLVFFLDMDFHCEKIPQLTYIQYSTFSVSDALCKFMNFM